MISKLYAATVFLALPVVASASLVGYWDFEASDATDSSAMGNNGTLVNSPTFGSDVPSTLASTSTQAISFNGVNGSGSYVRIPHSSSLEFSGGAVTVSLWMKADATDTDTWLRMIGKDDSYWTPGFEVQRNSDSANAAVRVDTDSSPNQTKTFSNLWDGNWNHLVFTMDNGAVNVWMNGTNVVDDTYGHGSGFSNTVDLVLGRSLQENNREFLGLMDDVAIWNQSLSDTQVADLYAGVSPLTVVVPEPASSALLALLLGGVLVMARRRRQNNFLP